MPAAGEHPSNVKPHSFILQPIDANVTLARKAVLIYGDLSMLTEAEIVRIGELGSGRRAPDNGMEKHFLRVIRGECGPLTPVECEWVAVWQEISVEGRIDSSTNASELFHRIELSKLRRSLADLSERNVILERELQGSSEMLEAFRQRLDDHTRESRNKEASLEKLLTELKVELAEYRFRFGESEMIRAFIDGNGWRALSQEQLQAWREIRRGLGAPIPAEIERLELHKPEWLRGVTGAGPRRTASFVPIERD